MFLNILHRPRTRELYPFFQMQQDWVHELKLKVSIMLSYPMMDDPEIVADLKRYADEFGDELGIFLCELGCEKLKEKTGHEMDAIWLYSREDKRRILELVLSEFRDQFDREPAAVAAYHLDSSSLSLLRELCPTIKCVVAGCFEEGVRVFHGCNHSWYLFTEGMPWGPWYPSKGHTLRPAADEQDAMGVVAVTHLSRDMVLSYEDRNDFWASHPGNVMRGMGNEGDQCPYNMNLIDQYRAQEKYNDGFSYLNVFVGPNWLTWFMDTEDPPEVSQKLHREQYEYLAKLRDEGKVRDCTLSEFADWFKQNRPIGTPEVYFAREMVYGSGKHYFWYLDPNMRVLVDTMQGGSIGDLRPYAAQFSAFTGPDSPSMAMGSYPYLIHSQYRTGMANHWRDGARTTLEVTRGDETLDLATCPTYVAAVERDEDGHRLVLTPAQLCFTDGLNASIQTTYRFTKQGRIIIERKLTDLSDAKARLLLREYVKACWGYTEYAEDMHGIKLSVQGKKDQSLVYDYQSRTLRTAEAKSAAAIIPQVNCELKLEALDTPAETGQAIEGCMFTPFYTLTLEKTVGLGETFKTCLSVSKAV